MATVAIIPNHKGESKMAKKMRLVDIEELRTRRKSDWVWVGVEPGNYGGWEVVLYGTYRDDEGLEEAYHQYMGEEGYYGGFACRVTELLDFLAGEGDLPEAEEIGMDASPHYFTFVYAENGALLAEKLRNDLERR